MLQIFINDKLAEIKPDTSILLSFNNPLFEDDTIPTPHSYPFQLAASELNLSIIGESQRIGSTDSIKRLLCEIFFDGIRIVSGNLTVDEITSDGIKVEIEGLTFLSKFKKRLHKNDLGRIVFGKAQSNVLDGRPYITFNPQLFYDYWEDQRAHPTPNFVAATTAIKDVEWLGLGDPGDDRPPLVVGGLTNIRSMRFGQYHNEFKYRLGHIIPSIRVAYIMNKIHPNLAAAFSTDAFKNLMLVCSYHPTYHSGQVESGIWTIDGTTLDTYANVCDYMPDVETSVFVGEMLKIMNASLYTINGEPVVELNKTILASTNAIDWSTKIRDDYSISFERGSHYKFSFDSQGDEELPLDTMIQDYTDLTDLLFNRRNNAVALCRLLSTGQVFESHINPALSDETHTHYSFSLLKDSPTQSGHLVEDEEDITDIREVSCGVRPVRNVIVEEVPRDGMRQPKFDSVASLNAYNYIPEIENSEKSRPTVIDVGHYTGLQGAMMASQYTYPQITATGVSPAVPLVGDGIFSEYHVQFSDWLGRIRRVISCSVKLNALDIYDLDLRVKVSFAGQRFLIRSLDVSINSTDISLADVELVEE